ncbi:MAG: O-antigen ligase family protein, partial [Planctomycetaceae bacterium]
ISHFPFGSGLGTYGYATLPSQSEPSAYWFREAHNEYLETFAESVLFGLPVLAFAMVWFARRSLGLASTSRRGDHVAMGICGLMLFVCAAVQSITDFVITIPANALLYASFFGVVGSVPLGDAVGRPSASPAKQPAKGPGWSIAWALLIVVMLMHCVSYAQLERQGDEALAQTPVGDLRDAVSEDVLAERIAILDKAISLQPDRASLYRHRAMYHLAQYRTSVIETGKQSGETIAWGNTQPEAIYAILETLPPASRQATVDSLVSTDAMRRYLGIALGDLAAGLHHNPLFGQLHLTAAALSPITRWDSKPFIARSFRLSQSDPEKLYACGLLGWLSSDRELMVDAWRSCLRVTRAYEQPIVDRALQKLTPREIAVEMAPRSSPDMLITLVRTVLSPREGSGAVRYENGKKIATDVAEIVLTDLVGTADRRHVVAATIYELADAKDLAAEQWLQAVDSSPTNISYRYQAAKALRSLGKLDEALHQVVLGSSLTVDPVPFQQLAIQIRADIAKTTK